MPTTTTAVNGCGATIMVEDENGTLVDVSGQANEASLKRMVNIGEYAVFGDVNIYRLECKSDAELSVSILESSTIGEASDLFDRWIKSRGLRTVRVRISNKWYFGRFLLENADMSVKADDAKPVITKASLKPSGGVNWEYA